MCGAFSSLALGHHHQQLYFRIWGFACETLSWNIRRSRGEKNYWWRGQPRERVIALFIAPTVGLNEITDDRSPWWPQKMKKRGAWMTWLSKSWLGQLAPRSLLIRILTWLYFEQRVRCIQWQEGEELSDRDLSFTYKNTVMTLQII